VHPDAKHGALGGSGAVVPMRSADGSHRRSIAKGQLAADVPVMTTLFR